MTNPGAGGQQITGSPPGTAAAPDGTALIIAVDGPAGSGKSTAARATAAALGLRYLDTGAMYRALTWWLLARDADVADAATVAELAGQPQIEISTDPGRQAVRVDGADVTAQIRTRQVSNAVSAVAAVPGVRRHLIARQRAIIADAIASGHGIVAEGRDIGRVVAPQAAVKVFLTASEEVRARRRNAELPPDRGAGAEQTQIEQTRIEQTRIEQTRIEQTRIEQTRIEQARRDGLDAPQTERAADAVQIESSGLRPDEVVSQIIGLARRAGAACRQ